MSAWPGVVGVLWVRVISSSPVSGVQREASRTRGVPACSYQAKKADRSRPETSAKQAMKASTVVAWPSQRSK